MCRKKVYRFEMPGYVWYEDIKSVKMGIFCDKMYMYLSACMAFVGLYFGHTFLFMVLVAIMIMAYQDSKTRRASLKKPYGLVKCRGEKKRF